MRSVQNSLEKTCLTVERQETNIQLSINKSIDKQMNKRQSQLLFISGRECELAGSFQTEQMAGRACKLKEVWGLGIACLS